MKNTIIDFDVMTESVRKDGRRHDYLIDEIKVYRNFLYYKRRYVNHMYHEHLEYYLFPQENIGIYKLYQYKDASYNPSDVYKYYVDMVSVSIQSTYWNVKDLYIDFIIKKDNNHYVVDIDEFNAAIQRNELNNSDITNALNGLDSVLKGYYADFDMDKYINKLKIKYTHQNTLVYSKG